MNLPRTISIIVSPFLKNRRTVFFAVSLCTAMLGTINCAYFNTFYNTKKAFKSGERAIKKNEKGQGATAGITFFDQCIEKGSKVLEFYPGSRYVDDTLFLMGKSFFYKGEYVDAIRKFEELKGVFPESEFIPEAELWWGKSLIRLGDYDDAHAKLNELLTSFKVKKAMRNEALLEMASMSFRQGIYEDAVKAYGELANLVDDEKALAKAWYFTGLSYNQIKQYSKAAESFLKVFDYKPSEEERYLSKFNAGVSYKLDNEFEKASEIFNELMKDGKNSEQFPEIRLEIADCLTRQGKKEEAIQEFKDIAEFYPRTIASTRAYGLIGLIHYQDRDYPRAKASFDSSLRGVRDSLTTDKVTQFTGYLRTLEEYHINIDTVLKELRQGKKAERKESMALRQDSASAPAPGDSLQIGVDTPQRSQIGKILDEAQEMENSNAKHFYLAGELFLYKIGVADSSKWYFDFIVENFKNSIYAPRSLLQMAHIHRDVEQDTVKAEALLQRIIKEYPEDEYVNFARREMGIESVFGAHDSLRGLFLKAESLFFDIQDYEEALKYYSIVCDSFPACEYAPKSRYIIAWYYENALYDKERALEEYEKLLDDFPESPYYRMVEGKVKMVEQQLKNKPEDNDKREKESSTRGRRGRYRNKN